MILNQFNGGINKKDAPHFIAVNEAIEYTNIDNITGELKPILGLKTSSPTYINKYKIFNPLSGNWVSTNPAPSTFLWSVRSGEKVYVDSGITTIAGIRATWVNNLDVFRQLGIAAPTVAPTVAIFGAGLLTGDYTYVFTYYDSTTGWESAPSPISASISPVNNTVRLTNISTCADNDNVNQKRIYRVGGTLTKYSLVFTISNGQNSYDDGVADSLIPGDALTTSGYLPAPDDLKYLTEYNGMLFGASGRDLCPSLLGMFHVFRAEYRINFNEPITGLAILSNFLAVFTESKTYLVMGNTHSGLTRMPLFNTGCVNAHTIAYLHQQNAIAWVSVDGICISQGSDLSVITDKKLLPADYNFATSTINAAEYRGVYYLQLDDTQDYKILAFDARFSPILKELNLDTNAVLVIDNLLYGSSPFVEPSADYPYNTITVNKLCLMFSEDEQNINYTSAEFNEGSFANRKHYKHIYVRSSGYIDISIVIDGVVRLNKILTTTDTHDLQPPQEYNEGYSIQFIVSGTGTIKEISW